MTMIEMAQWAIIPIYSMAAIFSLHNILIICRNRKVFHYIINGIILMACTSYIALQFDWILGSHGEELPSWVDLAWLLHEYLVGVILLTLTAMAPVFIEMEEKK